MPRAKKYLRTWGYKNANRLQNESADLRHMNSSSAWRSSSRLDVVRSWKDPTGLAAFSLDPCTCAPNKFKPTGRASGLAYRPGRDETINALAGATDRMNKCPSTR